MNITPVKEEYTGSPIKPIKTYTTTATVVFVAPSTTHAKNITKLDILIGTAPIGIVSGETIQIIAVKSAILVRFFTEKVDDFTIFFILTLHSLLPMKRF